MKKVLIIDKCQDCKYYDCKLRTLVGLIPQECPLMPQTELTSNQLGNIEFIENMNKESIGV